MLLLMRFFLPLLLSSAFLLFADDRVKVDNDAVRILDVVDLPHHRGALHRHQVNRVMVYLEPGDIEIRYADGSKQEQHWKANQVAWSPSGAEHTSENVGTTPIRIIEIELKKSAPAVPVQRKPELDPVRIDPQHNVVEFENNQVRVFRTWREPGESEKMHEHAGTGRANVLLTDLDGRVKFPDGSSKEQHGKRGDILWSGPVVHAAMNTGTSRFEMIVVEVK